MKAIKFIVIIGFLFAFRFIGATQLYSQETENNKTRQTSDKPETEKNTIKTVQAQDNSSNLNVKPSEERYRIGLLDVLEVSVYKFPELSQKNIRMDESGRIRLPRIDTPILAVCKTENELSEEIVELYKKSYLRNPYVTVFVKEQNSQPLSVIGAVQKPGNFYTSRRLTLLELLSFAGGQDVEKAGSKIQVARVGGISGCNLNNNGAAGETGGVTFFKYNLADVLEGKTNPVMRPGDIVVVLEAEQAYVTGNVVKPQAVPLKQTVTLTQAIAAAGGVLPATKKSQVKLIRQGADGKIKEESTFDLVAIKDKKISDPVLQANDIVEVPTDKVKDFTNNFIKAITGGFGNVFYRIP